MVVGDWQWTWYQEACAQALEKLGCTVGRFGWVDEFKRRIRGRSEPVYRSWWHRVEARLQSGPVVWAIRRRLVRAAAQQQPDIVFFYNVQLIDAATVRAMRRATPGAVFVQYANDNPFSSRASVGLWRNFLESIACFDLHLAYRHANLADFSRLGAQHVEFMRSYFVPTDDFPIPVADIDPRYRADVVFAGHYESDGRVAALEAVCRAGLKLNLFGGGWNAARPTLAADSPLHALYPIQPAVGADYRQALNGAKVALCFLSRINGDTYTRRNFQIPAMEVAMLTERTEDLASLFRGDDEAAFFGSTPELVEQATRLVQDDAWRRKIAVAGRERVWRDGHHVEGRMSELLRQVGRVRAQR